jgi:hypothetical protein
MAGDRWHRIARTATGQRDIERRFRPFHGENLPIASIALAKLILENR